MTPTIPWPAEDIASWLPVWQAMAFFLATFVLEDVATVGAGLLLATGAVTWPVAFGACFLGIWLGDAGLYGLARFGGRSWFERSRLNRFADKVAKSEEWFAQRGTAILIFSRLMPGARLPTYLAAGFLRVPLPRFLVVTGSAAFVWTIILLLFVQSVGVKVLEWLGVYKQGGLAILAVALAAFFGLRLIRFALRQIDTRLLAARIGRWRHWEFWPAWMFYPPVAMYCMWLAFKYRGATLPTLANPGIFSGGMVGESKIEMLESLYANCAEFVAQGWLLRKGQLGSRVKALEQILDRNAVAYPFILKPDLGQRGAGIRLVRSREQALAYLQHTSAPLLVQRYAPGPFEAGIFYYRFPHEQRGRIFAITEKVFPTVTGDGKTTIADLILNDSRARFMADKYLCRFAGRENDFPAVGEELKLVEAGNHAQGCIFRDGHRLLTPELESRIDQISQGVDGFFIGRYDIRYANEEDFKAGRNFQIIELNGAASEATSIYDAENSIFDAYKTLFKQWDLVFAIGAANRERGCAPTPLSLVFRKWREYGRLAATYPPAD